MEKFELKLTATLYRKLCEKSKKEGVTVNELASELLAEGLVLRAWEIMERKIAMKQPAHSNSANNNSHSQVKQNYKGFGNRSRNRATPSALTAVFLRSSSRNRENFVIQSIDLSVTRVS